MAVLSSLTNDFLDEFSTPGKIRSLADDMKNFHDTLKISQELVKRNNRLTETI
jgi:hypothetical protein